MPLDEYIWMPYEQFGFRGRADAAEIHVSYMGLK